MKKITILLAICVSLTLSSYAQTTSKAELNKLNKEVVQLYKAGKLDKAIEVSDQIVDLAKNSNSVEKRTLAIYLATSARLKKEMFQALAKKFKTERMKRDEQKKVIENANKYAISAEENFKDAIKMFDGLKSKSQQSAFAKSQYAWLLHNHSGKKKRTVVAGSNRLERFKDAEKMYLEALDSYDKSMGVDSDSSILTVFDIAEFYLNWTKFEKSIPFYNRFIRSVEKKYGKKQSSLAPALSSLSQIMITTEREVEAETLNKRISTIINKKNPAPKANFDLSLRRKYSANIKETLVETIRPDELINGRESYNNSLAILRGGRRGGPETKYSFDNNSSIGITNNNIWVEILVDEKGKVLEAKPVTNEKVKDKNAELIVEAEKAVKAWKFEPFKFEGKRLKMRGFVLYTSSEVR